MKRAVIVGAGLAVAGAIASCSSFSGTPATGENDAPPPDSGAVDASDAAPSITPDAGCYDLADDFTNGIDDGWLLFGRPDQPSRIETANGPEVQLTKGVEGSQSGVIWHEIPIASTSLTVSVDLDITTTTSSMIADGFAVMWAPATTDVSDLGPGSDGANLGVCRNDKQPTGGTGIGVTTYALNGQNFAVIDANAGADRCLTRVPTNLTILDRQTLSIRVFGGKASATLTAPAQRPQTMPTQPLPHTDPIGWIGFGAGVGSFYSQQSIGHVRVHACPQ